MTDHVIDSLSEFMDDALPAASAREVAAHLSACASCQGELEDLRAASKMVKDLPQAELPIGFMQRLERRRNEEPAATPWLLPFPARVAAFALSSVIVGLVVYDKFQGPGARLDSIASNSAAPTGAFSDMPTAPAAAPAMAPQSLAPAEAKLEMAEMKARSFDGSYNRPERHLAKRALAGARGRSLREDNDSSEGTGLSGAAAASVRGFSGGGGAPIGEAMPQAPKFSNESLQKDLERQKSSMGIRQILPRDDSKQKSAEEDEKMISAGFTPPKLDNAPQPRIISPVPHMKALSSGAGAAAAAKSADILGVVAPFEGVVVRRPADMPAAWAQAGLEVAPPTVNFSRHAVVIAPGAITEVRETNGRVVVHYRDGGPQAIRYALIEATKLAVVFEKDR